MPVSLMLRKAVTCQNQPNKNFDKSLGQKVKMTPQLGSWMIFL